MSLLSSSIFLSLSLSLSVACSLHCHLSHLSTHFQPSSSLLYSSYHSFLDRSRASILPPILTFQPANRHISETRSGARFSTEKNEDTGEQCQKRKRCTTSPFHSYVLRARSIQAVWKSVIPTVILSYSFLLGNATSRSHERGPTCTEWWKRIGRFIWWIIHSRIVFRIAQLMLVLLRFCQ